MSPPRSRSSRVAATGPISFAEFVEWALYDPDRGFYAAGTGTAGRRGDFLTSPEVGPLFGAVVAGALDAWWEELGRPDQFTVVEAAAGTGAMARSVLAHRQLGCREALRYIAVERSRSMRDQLEGIGPPVEVADRMPDARFVGVVLANELLDNLPFDLYEFRDADGWHEVRVVQEADGSWTEQLVPGDAEAEAWARSAAPDASDRARIPRQRAAAAWLTDALDRLERGRVVVFDYADTTSSMARRPTAEWLRTYRQHARGAHPLVDPGSQDITCEVAIDQLAAVATPDRDRRQAAWLTDHGIDALVEDGKRIWHERAHLGDLEAIRARSRVIEAEALRDPTGLGAFHVLEWEVGGRVRRGGCGSRRQRRV
ncbi:MAG: SAM-dependent methyltransferase [Acidimicrobiales bacterium]